MQLRRDTPGSGRAMADTGRRATRLACWRCSCSAAMGPSLLLTLGGTHRGFGGGQVPRRGRCWAVCPTTPWCKSRCAA